MRNNELHTPDGFRDYLPPEQFFKKRIEDGLESVFHRYGYSSVATPVLEYAEVFADKGSVDPRQMYRFIDRDGDMLTLRSDLTPPVARVIAANFADGDMPLRFCYAQNVFRYSPSYQGKLREIPQAGIELVGAGGDEADAETLAVAIDALLGAGLKDFRIDVGQVRFLQGMLEESGLEPSVCETLRERIAARDFVAAEAIGKQHRAPPNVRRLLSDLPIFSGNAEILDEVLLETDNEKSREALQNLKNIHSILKDYGFEKYVLFDLSMAGKMDYYTGIIFRGYTSGLGFSILDGGRYDGLLARFGLNLSSVGFIIKVHNLACALKKQNPPAPFREADFLIAWDGAEKEKGERGEGRNAALAEAVRLRNQGRRCVLSFAGKDAAAALEYAKRRGIGKVLYFGGGERRLLEIAES
jgi:ATP phosphoribosyltransferase regulatory subunit